MSPLVWDLAHIGNQEEQWLLRAVAAVTRCAPTSTRSTTPSSTRGRAPHTAAARPRRGTRYVAEVRGRVLDILESTPLQGGRWSMPASPSA